MDCETLMDCGMGMSYVLLEILWGYIILNIYLTLIYLIDILIEIKIQLLFYIIL